MNGEEGGRRDGAVSIAGTETTECGERGRREYFSPRGADTGGKKGGPTTNSPLTLFDVPSRYAAESTSGALFAVGFRAWDAIICVGSRLFVIGPVLAPAIEFVVVDSRLCGSNQLLRGGDDEDEREDVSPRNMQIISLNTHRAEKLG